MLLTYEFDLNIVKGNLFAKYLNHGNFVRKCYPDTLSHRAYRHTDTQPTDCCIWPLK